MLTWTGFPSWLLIIVAFSEDFFLDIENAYGCYFVNSARIYSACFLFTWMFGWRRPRRLKHWIDKYFWELSNFSVQTTLFFFFLAYTRPQLCCIILTLYFTSAAHFNSCSWGVSLKKQRVTSSSKCLQVSTVHVWQHWIDSQFFFVCFCSVMIYNFLPWRGNKTFSRAAGFCSLMGRGINVTLHQQQPTNQPLCGLIQSFAAADTFITI